MRGDSFEATLSVRNPGDVVLPFSVGAHPAWRWPLADGVAKEAHTLTFAEPEPEPIRRLDDDALSPELHPTPVDGRVLHLRDSLYTDDAVMFFDPHSSSVVYSAPGAPSVEIAWTGFAELGNWTKPGADFIAIEPWHGYADPVGFAGDFTAKPGLAFLAPGATATYGWSATVTD